MPDGVDFGAHLGEDLNEDLSRPLRTPESLRAWCQARDTLLLDDPVDLAASFFPKPNKPIIILSV